MTIFEIPTSGNIIIGSYDIGLVFLSYVIAVFASYTSLDLASGIKGDFKGTQKIRIGGCALSMGCGIWSMHFTAMLAFQLPMEVSHHTPLTLLSLVLAVMASGYGLFYCNTPPINSRKIVSGGIVMGFGVSAMHYIGMAAMQMDATLYYTPGLFVLSVIIGIGAATAALWLLIHGSNVLKNIKALKIISAFIMGIAVFGMHFTGMAATNFVSIGNEKIIKDSLMHTDVNMLALGVVIFTLIIFGVTILASLIHRLAKQDASTKAILDGVVDGIITFNGNGKILSFNRAVERLFGYLARDLIGKNVKILMPDSYREEHDHYFKNYLSTGQANIIGNRRESVGLRKDGKTFPLHISISKIIFDDEVSFTGILRDISEIKEHESRLKEAVQIAEKANLAKSEFLSRMSHELRTPLNAILGFAQLLCIKQDEVLTDSQKDKVNEILTAGNHLLVLINEVLDLARIESGEISLSLEQVNFQDVLTEIVSIIRPIAEQKDVQFYRLEPPKGDLTVIADRTRLKQVFLNLLSNAIKYNREGGSVSLESEITKENTVIFHITDTGRGISKNNLSSLFEPFNRLEADLTNIEGTGIGLCITKRLVELMNGSIAVESTLGVGSQFSIELPIGDNLGIPIDKIEKSSESKITKTSNDLEFPLIVDTSKDMDMVLWK